MNLTLETHRVDGTTIITVGGEVDLDSAPRLRELVLELVAADELDLVLDMQAVDLVDSTGVGVLVRALKVVMENGGSLQLVCTQERLRKIFRIAGLDQLFAIHDSTDAALAR